MRLHTCYCLHSNTCYLANLDPLRSKELGPTFNYRAWICCYSGANKYNIEYTKHTEQLKLTTTIVAIQYKVLRTYREFVTDTMPMMATANISAKTMKRITTMVIIIKVSKMTVLQVVSLTLAFPRCCLPWYILRSFERLRNILPSDVQNTDFSTQFAHLDLPRLTQIGYRNVIQGYQGSRRSIFWNHYLRNHILTQCKLATLEHVHNTPSGQNFKLN